jgi:NAD(P)-dependent dehydrogenase (short-subunit alcohol dehydrogenase family)
MSDVILIVGAGPGMGAAVGRRFAREGFKVALAGRTLSKVEGLAADIDGAKGFACDATDEASVKALFDAVKQDMGEPNVVVFNASGRVRASILDIEVNDFEKAWQISCLGGFIVGRDAARIMTPKGKGTILFTGATASVKSYANSAGFAVGKFGLRALSYSMAREFGPKGIHVAHVVIDGGIRADHRTDYRQHDPENPDKWLDPDAIADNYWMLHAQHRSSWTSEIDVRPWVENF